GQRQRAAVAIGVGGRVIAGRKGTEPLFEISPKKRKHASGLAVKRSGVPDELELLRDGLRQPQGGFDGFRASREKSDARQPGRRETRQELEKPRANLRRKASECEPLDLRLQRLDVMRMAMPHASHGDAGDEIDVGVAVLVVEP